MFSPSHLSPILTSHAYPIPNTSSAYSRSSGSPPDSAVRRAPMSRNPSSADFQVERIPRVASRKSMPSFDAATEEILLSNNVASLVSAKSRLFTVSGRIPMDPTHLNLFFRSKSGITHSLDFPIDPTINTPPALDVLIAACRPHPTADDVDDFVDRESLFYPPNLPLTASLELSNHPILEAVRSTLFPGLSHGNYLTTVRDKLEVLVDGGRMAPQPRQPNDGRVCTVHIVLPSRFRGGGRLIVRDIDGTEEQFTGRGGKSGHMEWVAMLADSEYEVETVHKGCRLSISYAVFMKSFGPSGPDPLIHPSDAFLDTVSPILNLCRGRQIAFHLIHEYNINPAEVLADSIVPMLKGGDSMLYHALRAYKLAPELHYYAGGHIWPVHMTVNLEDDEPTLARSTSSFHNLRNPLSVIGNSSPTSPTFSRNGRSASVAGGVCAITDYSDGGIRGMVEASGGLYIVGEGINLLTDAATMNVGKQRVSFFANGEMEKLVLNVLVVAYVP